MNKWYMNNPESFMKNETHKILCAFDIQADPLISARLPHVVIVHKKKRTRRKLNFAVPAHHIVKLKESEKKDKCVDLAMELKKTMEHESYSDTNSDWCSRYNHCRISTGSVGLTKKDDE